MNEKTKNAVYDLLYLLSCAVNGEAPDKARCEKMDLSEVYSLSQYHMLTSAAAFALEKSIELPREFDQAKKKAIRKLALFEIERAKILAAFEKNGIWYLPLKGILLAKTYPKAAMREMCDNDILCDSGKMQDVRDIMESMGFTCDLFDQFNHDVYSKPPSIEFEIHHNLFDSDMPRFVDYYTDVISRLKKDGNSSFGYRFSDEDFYIFMLCHMYKHYINAGTGLRSLLDLYVFNRSHRAKLDLEYVAQELKTLGIEEYERSVRNLADKAFGQEGSDVSESEELEYFVFSGYCGTEGNANYNYLNKQLGGDDSGSSKRKYLLRRIFISGDDLRKSYPFFYRHKALYPLLLIYRPIKGAVTHPKGIAAECKRLKGFKVKE